MTKYFKFAAPLLIMASIFLMAPAAQADFSAKNSIECGVNTAAGGDCTTDPPDAGPTLTELVKSIINILSVLVGAIAVIMIIIAGFRYVTSAGNDSAVSGAKNTIIYAIVGLIIVAVAQIIVHFVLNNLISKSSSDSETKKATPSSSTPIRQSAPGGRGGI